MYDTAHLAHVTRIRWQATAARSASDPSLIVLHFVGWDESRNEVSVQRAVFGRGETKLFFEFGDVFVIALFRW
jgi:hypothetical protein